jgi:hypothetical protein
VPQTQKCAGLQFKTFRDMAQFKHTNHTTRRLLKTSLQQLTPCSEVPSWHGNSTSTSHGIPRLLWNHRIYCRGHGNRSPSPVPILSQINPIHTLKQRSTSVWSSQLRQSFPFTFDCQHTVRSYHPIRATWPIHLIFFHFIILIIDSK